ncbi:MAG: hypothetical protein PVI07_08000 [Anaerolineae bacterium]
MKRVGYAVAMAVSLLLILTSAVYAADLRGTGALHAWGDGMAGVQGDVETTVTGNGLLFIRDRGGDGEWTVSGTGRRKHLPGGWTMYLGFSGTVEAQGSRITVLMSGYDIELRAEGTGVALLFGEGRYETRHGDDAWSNERPWPSKVKLVRLGASE